MYVNKINSILKANAPVRIKLFEGSTIAGKILSVSGGKGSIKLYDGTIIPAIFNSENNVEKDKFIKFKVQSFDGDNFTLKIVNEDEDSKDEKSFNTILSELNIPQDEGKDIILSLIKYNIPASDENINKMHHNLQFLKTVNNMTDSDILFFLNQYMDEEVNENSTEFRLAKDMFSKLKNIDMDFLAFMQESDIPVDFNYIFKTQSFMDNKFLLNSFIDNLKNAIEKFYSQTHIHNDAAESTEHNPVEIKGSFQEAGINDFFKAPDNRIILSKFLELSNVKPSVGEKTLIDSLIKELSEKMGLNKKEITISTLQEAINIFKDNKDMFSAISQGGYKKLLDHMDVFKQLLPNYNLHFFNLYDGGNIFKNNIIIKNKYKGSNYIDINDVKAYITVETKNIGRVDCNLYKKNDDLAIAFFTDEEYVDLFRQNAEALRNNLKENGYKIINVSVEKSFKNLLPFSDFFNDSIIKDLDVKV